MGRTESAEPARENEANPSNCRARRPAGQPRLAPRKRASHKAGGGASQAVGLCETMPFRFVGAAQRACQTGCPSRCYSAKWRSPFATKHECGARRRPRGTRLRRTRGPAYVHTRDAYQRGHLSSAGRGGCGGAAARDQRTMLAMLTGWRATDRLATGLLHPSGERWVMVGPLEPLPSSSPHSPHAGDGAPTCRRPAQLPSGHAWSAAHWGVKGARRGGVPGMCGRPGD
jgi:hypothetical protein